MGTKAMTVNSDSQPKRQGAGFVDSIKSGWAEFTSFLTDVRAETRKVVTPSRKEVQATTTVVIVAVFLFGLYFFVVDGIFSLGMNRLMQWLGGLQ